jgi:hypothetical protein
MAPVAPVMPTIKRRINAPSAKTPPMYPYLHYPNEQTGKQFERFPSY